MKRIKKNEEGFSLVELLVVVIIIAIIAAIAIPSLLASRRAANEASAISSLRTVNSGEATYFATTGANQNYTTLTLLGAGGLIDSTLAAGAKSGYNFTGTAPVVQVYCATAVPTSTGLTGTGDRSFSVSQPGVIYAITGATAPSCSATDGSISTGSPIQ